jgi:hypothetical protein
MLLQLLGFADLSQAMFGSKESHRPQRTANNPVGYLGSDEAAGNAISPSKAVGDDPTRERTVQERLEWTI